MEHPVAVRAGGILRALSADGELPRRVQLLPKGWVRSQAGDFLADEEAMALIVQAWASRQVDVVIDYEHQSLGEGLAPAAGWIRDLSVGEDGLYAEVEWTPKAAEMIRAREYRYLSPAVGIRESDRRAVYLHSVALTNTPAIHGMRPVVNRGGRGDMDLLGQLKAALGLEEQADEAAVLAEIAKLKEAASREIVAHKAVLEALELPETATVDEVKAKILVLKNPSGYVPVAQFQELQRRLDQREAEDLVQEALRTGRIAPASAEWLRAYALKDIAAAREFVRTAPVVVPVGTPLAPNRAPAPAVIDEVQARINRQLGITDEIFQKWNGGR